MMFPMTFADSQITLGAFSFIVLKTKSSTISSAILGFSLVEYSIASIQVALTGSFEF